MKMMIKKMIVDADVCIKLGQSDTYPFLRQLLPCISEKVVIHQYVYDEILIPASVKKQLNSLTSVGTLEIIDASNLSINERAAYDATYKLLAGVMMNPNNPRQNHGEVSSLAMAKTLSIPVFFTDERDLQPIIDRNLNTGIDDIKCIRLIDVMNMLKHEEIEGFNRKQAKAMWVMSGKNKELFDSEIWPIGKSL